MISIPLISAAEEKNARPYTWADTQFEIARQNLDKSLSKKVMDVSLDASDLRSSPKKETNKSMTDLTSPDKETEKQDTELSRSCEDFSVNSDLLLFGEDLKKHPLDGSIELPSDQVIKKSDTSHFLQLVAHLIHSLFFFLFFKDSTGGEDEDETIGEEDISKLHPNLLLYKAAAAHNLPVMCEALGFGADKLWTNSEDLDRSSIHQAILSVSLILNCRHL